MARMTKKLVREIWDWTDVLYREVLIEEYASFWKVFKPEYVARASVNELKEELWNAGLPMHSEVLNAKYLDKIVQLDSDKLSLILEAHQKGKIKRAQHTLDTIMDELLRRGSDGKS